MEIVNHVEDDTEGGKCFAGLGWGEGVVVSDFARYTTAWARGSDRHVLFALFAWSSIRMNSFHDVREEDNNHQRLG